MHINTAIAIFASALTYSVSALPARYVHISILERRTDPPPVTHNTGSYTLQGALDPSAVQHRAHGQHEPQPPGSAVHVQQPSTLPTQQGQQSATQLHGSTPQQPLSVLAEKTARGDIFVDLRPAGKTIHGMYIWYCPKCTHIYGSDGPKKPMKSHLNSDECAKEAHAANKQQTVRQIPGYSNVKMSRKGKMNGTVMYSCPICGFAMTSKEAQAHYATHSTPTHDARR